jgi:hypothetical protein
MNEVTFCSDVRRHRRELVTMRKHMLVTAVAAFGVLSMVPVTARQAQAQSVFQAAGPNAAAIQGTVDAYRAALGDPNNPNGAAPLPIGRREINWDGGGSDVTTAPVTPFDTFTNSRGGRFTTPGIGLSQAPPEGGPQGGLAGPLLFNNPSYGDIFQTFSSPRLFTPVGSRITDGEFFVPGANPSCGPPSCPDVPLVAPAAVRGFGAVFTDVDKPGGNLVKNSTTIEYFGADGRRIYLGLVPPSPGSGGLSFFGIVFDEPLIARVRITTGDSNPGPDDDARRDIVMMDDFLYGEPLPLAQ